MGGNILLKTLFLLLYPPMRSSSASSRTDPFLPSEFSLFWGTSTVITPFRTLEELQTLVGERYLIGSCMILTPHSSTSFLQQLLLGGSDHLILFTIPLSPLSHTNKRPPSFNFQKTRWNDFTLYIDSYCSAEEYSFSSCYAFNLRH